jgi:prevent-host-death family protein
MASVGIRELKQRTSEVVRRVRDRGEPVDVTFRGQVVARLVPVNRRPRTRTRAAAAVWAEIDELAQEISARWPEGVSAADAVAEQRRG